MDQTDRGGARAARIARRSIIRHPAASRRCSRTCSVTEARFEIAAHSERGDQPMPLDDTTMDLDSYARSLVLWMVGVAAAVYMGKVVLRRLPTGWVRTAPGHFRVPDGFALFLVGMATLLIVMEPVHLAGLGAEEVLSRWRVRLPYTAGAAFVAATLSGLLDHVGPLRAGLGLAWPSAMYAGMAWVLFLWLRNFIPPQDATRLSELVDYASPFLTLVTAYPGAAFASGATGAIVGRALGR